MHEPEIRLRIVETLMPIASKVQVTNPESLIETCSKLEKYVVGSKRKVGEPPNPQTKSASKKPG
jgi:hypothetical protein